MAQEVLKYEVWAAALKKLAATFRKWGITVGQGRKGITWKILNYVGREGLLLIVGLTEIVWCW